MHVNFGPRGILEINDARIIWRNFEGRGDKFNREGDRNFAVIIPDQEIADALIAEGWNVKIKAPREMGDEPFRYLKVKIKYGEDGRGPSAYLTSGKATRRLNEDTISIIDDVDIASVDLDIRPYDWEVNGSIGRSAYLQSIHVTQQVDRFAARFAEELDYE